LANISHHHSFGQKLAAPCLVESYCLALFSAGDALRAIAALAMLETIGGLLAPIVRGGLQTMRPEAGVLLVGCYTHESVWSNDIGGVRERLERL